MPTKAVIKKIPLKRKEVIVMHDCTKEEVIDHLKEKVDLLSIILTGNGDPEKGIMRRVALLNERQGIMLIKLEEIHDTIMMYHNETIETKNIAITVQNALERYQAEMNGIEKAKEKIVIEERAVWQKWVQTFAFIVGALGLCFTTYFAISNNRQSKANGQGIENLGTPVITNSRGVVQPLPTGDRLRMFPKDFIGDTISNDTTGKK